MHQALTRQESHEFEQLRFGGDSLSALSLATLLGEIFGIQVPVGVVISPANDLRSLAEHIDKALEGNTERLMFASVHGVGGGQAARARLV